MANPWERNWAIPQAAPPPAMSPADLLPAAPPPATAPAAPMPTAKAPWERNWAVSAPAPEPDGPGLGDLVASQIPDDLMQSRSPATLRSFAAQFLPGMAPAPTRPEPVPAGPRDLNQMVLSNALAAPDESSALGDLEIGVRRLQETLPGFRAAGAARELAADPGQAILDQTLLRQQQRREFGGGIDPIELAEMDRRELANLGAAVTAAEPTREAVKTEARKDLASAVIDIAEQEAAIAKIPKNPASEAIGAAGNWSDILTAFRSDPYGATRSFMLQSAPAMVPQIGATIVGGALGGVPGAALASGAAAYGNEFAPAIIEQIQRRGVNPEDAAGVYALMNGPDGEAVLRDAARAAGIISVVEGVTGGIFGKLSKFAPHGPMGRIAATGAELVAEPAGGAAGETAKQLAIEGKITPGGIAGETIGGAVPGVVQAGVVAAQPGAKTPEIPLGAEPGRTPAASAAPTQAAQPAAAGAIPVSPPPPVSTTAKEPTEVPPAPVTTPATETPPQATAGQPAAALPSPPPTTAPAAETPPVVTTAPQTGETPPVVTTTAPQTGETPPPAAAPVRGRPTGKTEQTTTARGTTIDTEFEVMEADDILTSDKKGYDPAIQPRQRGGRIGLETQVEDIRANLRPEWLGSSPQADRGSPILGPDNMAETGNGRIMALRGLSPEGRQRYNDWLKSEGYDIEGMKAPVLIRRRTTPMTPEQRRQFAIEANEATTAEMSEVEQAQADTDIMTPQVMEKLVNATDIAGRSNSAFHQAFIAALPAAQQNKLVDAQGNLSQAGARRIRNAVFNAAYGDPAMTNRITESTDDAVRSVSQALLNVAPAWAKMRARAKSGEIQANLDATKSLMEAVKRTADIRASNSDLKTALAQQDILNPINSEVEAFMRMLHNPEGKAASGKAMNDLLRFYAEEAQKAEARPGIFGEDEVPAITPEQIVKAGMERTHGKRAEQQTLGLGLGQPSPDNKKQGAPAGDAENAPQASLQRPPAKTGDGETGGAGEGSEAGRGPASGVEPNEAGRKAGPDTGKGRTKAKAKPVPKARKPVEPTEAEFTGAIRKHDVASVTETAKDMVRSASNGRTVEWGKLSDAEKRAAMELARAYPNLPEAEVTEDTAGDFDDLDDELAEADEREAEFDVNLDAQRETDPDNAADVFSNFLLEAPGDQITKKPKPKPPGRTGGKEGGKTRPEPEDFQASSLLHQPSDLDNVWTDMGIDPAEANAMPPQQQFNLLTRALSDRFGIKKILKAPDTTLRVAIDQMKDLWQGMSWMSHVMGLPPKAMGLLNDLNLVFTRDPVKFFGAYAYGKGRFREGKLIVDAPAIILPDRSRSWAHEWMHALDNWLFAQFDASRSDNLSGFIRAVESGVNVDPKIASAFDNSRKAFADLMRAIFYEIGPDGSFTQRDTKYFGLAQRLDQGGKAYWSKPTELLARAGEAYVAHKIKEAGGSIANVAKDDATYLSAAEDRMAKTFPKKQDRENIFAAFDNLFIQLGRDQPFGTSPLTERPADPILTPSNWDHIFSNKEQATLRSIFGDPKADLVRLRDSINGFARQAANMSGIKDAAVLARNTYEFLWRSMAGTSHAIARRTGSSAAQWLANHIGTNPGSGQTITSPYEDAIYNRIVGYQNELTAVGKQTGMDNFTVDELDQLRDIMTTGGEVDAIPAEFANYPDAVKQAALGMRKIMDKVWYDLKNAGIDIGYVRNGYLPRRLDHEAIERNPTQFIADAKQVYELDFNDDIGETVDDVLADGYTVKENKKLRDWRYWARAAVKAGAVPVDLYNDLAKAARKMSNLNSKIKKIQASDDPDPDAIAKLEEKLETAQEEFEQAMADMHDAVKDFYTTTLANAWLSNIRKDELRADDRQGRPAPNNFLKSRTMRPEADRIMKAFYLNHPVELVSDYIHAASRRAEFAKRFGSGGERIDTAMELARSQGVSKRDRQYLRQSLDIVIGRNKRDSNGMTKVADWTNFFATAGLLGRVTFTSLAEMMNIVVRSGRYGDLIRVPHRMFIEAFAEFGLMSKETHEYRTMMEMLGIVANEGVSTYLEAESQGLNLRHRSRLEGMQRQTYRFFGISALTRAQRNVAGRIGLQVMRSLAVNHLDGKNKEANAYDFAELGIPEGMRNKFSKWFLGYFADAERRGIDLPTPSELQTHENSAMTTLLRGALMRFADQSIQMPKKSDMPMLGHTPVLRLAYSLTRFFHALTRNILTPLGRNLYGTATGKLGPGGRPVSRSVAANRAILHTLPLMAGAVIVSSVNQFLREQLFPPADQEEKDWFDYILSGISGAGYFGSFDRPATWMVKKATGKSRYPVDIRDLLAGPTAASIIRDVQRVFGQFDVGNSPNTTAAEFQAARGWYGLLVKPSLVAILGSIKSPTFGMPAGLANMYLSSAQGRDAIIEGVTGWERPKPPSRAGSKSSGKAAPAPAASGIKLPTLTMPALPSP